MQLTITLINHEPVYIIAVLPTEMSRKHVSLWFFKGNVEIEARENAPLSQFRFTCESDLEICMERMLPKEPYPHVNSEHKGYALLLHAYIYILDTLVTII